MKIFGEDLLLFVLANSQGLVLHCKSLMYNRENNGPEIEPSGRDGGAGGAGGL